MAIEDSVPELAAEKAQRLPQGPAGVRRVEVWPKQREHGVAADTVVGVDGAIGEQGDALRLSEDRADRASVGPLQVHGSQRPQLDHTRTARGRRADGGQVTLRSRLGHWPALVWPMYAWGRYPPERFRVRPGRHARGVSNCRARWRFTCQDSCAIPSSYRRSPSLSERSPAETRRRRESLWTRESVSRASPPPWIL